MCTKMQRDIAPVPVIDDCTIEAVKQELSHLQSIPNCHVLEKFFIDQVTSNNPSSNAKFSESDYNQIKSLFSQCNSMTWPNINGVIDFYVYNYPAFKSLRRYYKENGVSQRIINQCFKEFFCYLKIKFAELPGLIEKTKKECRTKEKTSDICLDITGPSNIVDNLVFSSIGNNVQVRYHKGTTTSMLNNINALINYPQISVTFTIDCLNPQISFTRTCECSYNRFVATKDLLPKKTHKNSNESKCDNVLKSIELVDAMNQTIVYTYGFINEYMKRLLQIIKTSGKKVPDCRKLEFQTVINEFLADITELNLYNRNIFATNTLVKFEIGNGTYVRNRFVQSSNVIFREELTPEIALHLKHFNPQQTIDRYKFPHFKQLDFYADHSEIFEEILLDKNALIYTCLQCTITFYNSQDIIQHYQNEHHERSSVVCKECQQTQEIGSLASRRWKHVFK